MAVSELSVHDGVSNGVSCEDGAVSSPGLTCAAAQV